MKLFRTIESIPSRLAPTVSKVTHTVSSFFQERMREVSNYISNLFEVESKTSNKEALGELASRVKEGQPIDMERTKRELNELVRDVERSERLDSRIAQLESDILFEDVQSAPDKQEDKQPPTRAEETPAELFLRLESDPLLQRQPTPFTEDEFQALENELIQSKLERTLSQRRAVVEDDDEEFSDDEFGSIDEPAGSPPHLSREVKAIDPNILLHKVESLLLDNPSVIFDGNYANSDWD